MGRKEVSDKFIAFAINNRMVNINERTYDLSKHDFLVKKLGGVTKIEASRLLHYLKPVITRIEHPPQV
jgi:hypothetical protein